MRQTEVEGSAVVSFDESRHFLCSHQKADAGIAPFLLWFLAGDYAMVRRSVCAVMLLGLFLGAPLFAHADSLTVKTAQGTVHGKLVSEGRTRAFLGIPFAAPPVGDLRWKAPQPPADWKSVRDATNFAARCAQWPIWADYTFQDAGPSEDCLYLDVYTPAAVKSPHPLPVMVWIHGGGYAAGGSSEPRYSNSPLVDRGVVLVNINYRMGVFGFLASEDLRQEGGGAAGNYGLMDMVAALRWVQANAARFGGDPGNVTIFGESAGSFAVSTLMAAPQAQGLFQKAIGESGAPFGGILGVDSLETRAARDQAWVNSLGVKNLADARALSTDALIEAAKKKGVVGFTPVIDGRLLTESVPKIYAAGKQAHVPLLAGWNRDERAGTLSKGMTAEKWKAFASEHYGAHADEFLAVFPGGTDAQAVASADAYTTDQFISFGTWQWIEAQAKTGGAPVYRYHFELPAPASEMHPEGKYAWHSDDLEYVFGTLDVRRGSEWRPEDRKLTEQMMDYWTNFARTGDPNGPGLPAWPRYDKTTAVMHLDRDTHASPDTTRARYEFLLKETSATNP
jgi:para-nitrobenzyl esterase